MRTALSCLFIIPVVAMGIFPCAAELQWHQGKGFQWAELQVPKEGKPGFTLLTPDQTGITFTNPLDEHAIAANRVLADGSGVAIGDIYNNGLPDIFLCSLDGHSALYKNLGGMRFKDVTQGSGIVCSNRICRGAVFADINGDSWLDLLISTTGSGVLCFTNKGDGTFAECSEYAGTLSKYGAMTMALADIDGKGALDLYVANNRAEDSRDRVQFDQFEVMTVNGHRDVVPTLQDRFIYTNGFFQEYGEPDLVYLNDGKRPFHAFVLDQRGISRRRWQTVDRASAGLGPDRGLPGIWTATGRRTSMCATTTGHPTGSGSTMARVIFRPLHGWRCAIPASLRWALILLTLTGMAGWISSFWTCWPGTGGRETRQMLTIGSEQPPIGTFDDRPQIPRNVLFHNRGDGTFEEIANYAGVTASDWSWQPVFLDVDLDGFEDIIIPTGYVRDVNNMDVIQEISTLRRAGRLAPPEFGPDGKPVLRSAQEQRTEELYQGNLLASLLRHRWSPFAIWAT